MHGVLVDVYGEGVLITGESGIGKSEAALELIRRGHRLVTDDVVELRKVSDDTLVGSAPDITKHFIELRGIGIVDVKALFGALSVKIPRPLTWSSVWKIGIRTKSTTDWDWKRIIPNIWAIRWYATTFRFVPDVTWQLSARRQLSTTVRRRWATTQQKSYTPVYRTLWQKDVRRTRMMSKYAFGVDVGGTTVKLGLFNDEGQVLDKWEIPTVKDNGGEKVLPDIAASIKNKMQEKSITAADLVGVGIGAPVR